MVITFVDITERRRAEAERERLLAERTAVMEGMAEGIVLADATGAFFYFNPAALLLHGFASTEEMKKASEVGIPMFDLGYPDDGPMPVEEWPQSRMRRGETFTDLAVRVKGRHRPVEFIASYSGRPITLGGGRIGGLMTCRDITEAKAPRRTCVSGKSSSAGLSRRRRSR